MNWRAFIRVFCGIQNHWGRAISLTFKALLSHFFSRLIVMFLRGVYSQ